MNIELRGFARARPSSTEQAALRLFTLCQAWADRFGSGASWTVLTPTYERTNLRSHSQLERAFRASMPVRSIEVEPGSPTCSAVLFASAPSRAHAQGGATELARVELAFRLPEESPSWCGTHLEMTCREAAFSTSGSVVSFFQQLLVDVVGIFALDWANVTAPLRSASRGRSASAPRSGWLTYLSKSLGALPPIPPPTEVVAVDDHGWILVAQPEPVDPSNKDHQASLAYVRHALGARVLFDGPSFPPPAKPTPAESRKPEVVVSEMTAAPLVPSYLRAHSVAAPGAVASLSVPLVPSPAPSAQPAALLPSPVARPFSSETADIDISELVRTSLPFDPNAKPAREPESGKPAPSAKPASSTADTGTTTFDASEILQRSVPFAPARPAAGFGETEEFSLASLLKSGPAVPFEKTAAPAPSTPAPSPPEPLPAATPGRGRWIRFNPQTGEPLASPYWEDLPQPDRK